MPSGGEPVYQPTTVSVSYEPRGGGMSGVGADSALNFGSMLRRPRPQLGLLLFALIALACGIAMLVNGFAEWPATVPAVTPADTDGEHSPSSTSTETDLSACITPLLGGALIILLAIVVMGFYVKFAHWRRHGVCPCAFFDKKQSLARQLQCQNGGGCGQGIMALNPSTDPLVSHTQYAPVSEVPMRPEDEERRNLMPDSKDCLSSTEEFDRMLEPDPRIVLRPMGRFDDA